jgi:transposase-like protein
MNDWAVRPLDETCAAIFIDAIVVKVRDGLKGLPEVVGNVWAQAIVQTCIIHLIRNTFRPPPVSTGMNRRTVDLGEVRRNLPGRQPLGIQRQHHLIEPDNRRSRSRNRRRRPPIRSPR